MKKTLFLLLLLPSIGFAKNITLDIPDDDIKIVENDVLDAEQWIRDAWLGKLSKCKSRILKSETDRLIKEKQQIPAGGEDVIVKNYIDSDAYKKRADREKDNRK